MRTVQEIYDRYRIPPWLQEHQLRVAAVGKVLCGARKDADEHTVILLGLLHDMGNILKFDLTPDGPLAGLKDEKGIEYWQSVKEDFKRLYGADEHRATCAIAREIGVPENVINLMDGTGFSQIAQIKSAGALELQLLTYADIRIGLHGVLPMRQRIADLKERYKPRWAPSDLPEREQRFDANAALFEEFEHDLFAGSSLQPDDITDARIAPIIEELKKYPVS